MAVCGSAKTRSSSPLCAVRRQCAQQAGHHHVGSAAGETGEAPHHDVTEARSEDAEDDDGGPPVTGRG